MLQLYLIYRISLINMLNTFDINDSVWLKNHKSAASRASLMTKSNHTSADFCILWPFLFQRIFEPIT